MVNTYEKKARSASIGELIDTLDYCGSDGRFNKEMYQAVTKEINRRMSLWAKKGGVNGL